MWVLHEVSSRSVQRQMNTRVSLLWGTALLLREREKPVPYH